MEPLRSYPTRPGGGVIPNKNVPGGKFPSEGPGWSYMVVYSPFSGGGPSPRYRWEVWPEQRQARADLQQLLEEGHTLARPDVAANALRSIDVGEGDQLVLLSGGAALILFRVGPGERDPQAGTLFYDRWVAMMQAAPDTLWEMKQSFLADHSTCMLL